MTQTPERGITSPGLRVAWRFQPHPPGRSPVHSDEHLAADAEHPAGYPFEAIRGPCGLVCLEGQVYGGQRAALLKRIEDLCTTAHDDEALARELRAAVESVDGDFALLWYDTGARRVALAADRFGRLPLYYGATPRGMFMSRDQAFVLTQTGERGIDTTAFAQLLLFGYPLGARTLAAGVSRLLPREVLVASRDGWRLFPSPGSPFRRSVRENLPRDKHALARELRDAFVGSCRDRAIDAGSHVLSLSGGIDSRTTGAGMRAVLPSFAAVTFAAPGSNHADERDVAATVARTLGAEWRSYEFDFSSRASIDSIVRMKLGLNPADVAFGIDYVRRVKRDFPGPVTFWTGEGADKLLCEHRAIPHSPKPEQLVRFIIEKNAVMPPERVTALTGVSVEEMVESIRATLADDIEPEDAYVHFLLSQRVVRFHDEGEDRHRCAVWPVSPFFGADFVTLARAIPGHMKRERRLYRAFLRELAPDMAALPLAGGHAAPASPRFALEYALRDALRNSPAASALHRRVRAARGARRAPGGPWHAMLERLVDEGGVPEPLRAAEVRRIVSGEVPASPFALCMILTTAMAVRAIHGGVEP